MTSGVPRTGCWRCGKSKAEARILSRTGLCLDCSKDRQTENFLAMKHHDGPAFEHWRRRTLAAFGITALDETPADR